MNPEEGKEAKDPREEPHPVPGRRDRKRRTGSRFLLAVALAGCVIGALFAGARISDFICDVAGITSTSVRLGGKVSHPPHAGHCQKNWRALKPHCEHR